MMKLLLIIIEGQLYLAGIIAIFLAELGLLLWGLWSRRPLIGLLAVFVILPLMLNQIPGWLGIPLSTATISHIEIMVFGALIIFFLIVEPRGLARLWAIGKEKLRLWPFPH